jgi:nucleoside 2-deoxyribosyltransferase
MKVYFAGAIRAGRDLQPLYESIVMHLQAQEHEVLTTHVASKEVLSAETKFSKQQIYDRDVEWLNICDAMIADVTIPSLGVGYEIAYALHVRQRPVLCICQDKVNLSAMIDGNTHSLINIRYYSSVENALQLVSEYLLQLISSY